MGMYIVLVQYHNVEIWEHLIRCLYNTSKTKRLKTLELTSCCQIDISGCIA